MADKEKVIIICGPTASGKTDLSINLALKYNGEIISADSMQVYKGLDVGTAKVSKEEQNIITHHLIDIINPDEEYNVQLFVKHAKELITSINKKGKIPFIVGGTGLYIESLLNGINFTKQEKQDDKIKEELTALMNEKGKEHLYDMLLYIDEEYAKTVHPNNFVRVIRAIEVYKLTGKTMSYQLKNSLPKEKPYNSLVIQLDYSDRQLLYDRINLRVNLMLENKLLDEALFVYNNKDSFKNSVAAIGYKEFFPYFDKIKSLEECAEDLKQFSRNYAKRQLTWFNRMKENQKIYIDTQDINLIAEQLCDDFLK